MFYLFLRFVILEKQFFITKIRQKLSNSSKLHIPAGIEVTITGNKENRDEKQSWLSLTPT